MDIKDFEALVAVVESGSMTSAADRLQTSRSNISRRLKKLETELRVQLMRRTTRRVELTQIGIRLYEHAVKVMQEFTAMEAVVRDMGRALRGHLRVSVPIGLGQLVLAPALLDFCKENPEVTMQITFNNRIYDLLEDEIDVSIRVANSPPDHYVARELSAMEWVTCVSPDYLENHGTPRSPEELPTHALVTPPVRNNRLIMRFISGDTHHVVDLQPKLQCSDMNFLKQSVVLGNGIGVLPYYLISDELQSGQLVRTLIDFDPDPKMWGDKLYLITAPNLYPSQLIRTFLDYIRTLFSDDGSIGAILKNQNP
ncbi:MULTISPECIES: LysR family transcriptional regulator [Alcanivoracaceae]|uniref:LysR family transcriptional regulator n=2 Tax=Alcanivoracaceae TaxID=224372 RepID=A0A9Q3W775_9GAMM|nr:MULTISPECIES: LysR family transcriptional regulator [Alcanivoracaceae]KYZ84520.1 hypothetical protein A3Q32_09375 [Alcanivorax sp. KX64203]ARB46771.1 hypothetical protein P40_16250 [Alloalcanivorax xenomutans]KAF0807929.1 LysR family transcriptional regulator [Alcanivorax xiamenensis]MCE7509809.1 LysR family transcriptional regulator [Alloalcanivorax xenomutans]MCE7522685.1 LysR family transcriptional regulator [Alloalcanivorax xenomutans]